MSEGILEGQDGALGPQLLSVPPAPSNRSWQPEYDRARKTEEVKLRLSPQDALALRLSAKANALSTSAYVARLVAIRGNPKEVLKEEDPLADASGIAAALAQIPNEIRRIRGDLLRLGGLVKSLFIRGESMGFARQHALECSEALHALTRSADASLPVVARVEDELATVRVQLEQVILGLCRDR